MKIVFMGGFGVIDFERVTQMQQSFAYLSRLTDYPTDELLTTDFIAEMEKNYPATPQKAAILAFVQQLQTKDLLTVQKEYTHLFELNRKMTLYMSYYKYEDSRERGELLAKLKMLFEMFGVESVTAELTDYLPLMLEFLAFGDFGPDERAQDVQLLFSVIEDGTYELLAHSQEYEQTDYLQLIRFCRLEIAQCVVQEVHA